MTKKTVMAVVVTYNPPAGMQERMRAIAAEVDHIVVIDNASDTSMRDTLESICTEMPSQIECIWNDKNIGLAAALNLGISRILEQGADWVLLLDHDSQPQPGMVKTMLDAYASWPAQEKIALIAPAIHDINTAVATRYLMPRGKFGFRRTILNVPATDEALTVITSGSLVTAAAFQEAGLMPENYFVDYIDHAFCLALKERGLKILLVRDAILQHRLGEKTTHRLATATVVASNHSSFRRYYIFRNRIWIWKRYGRRFPGFVLHDVLASGFDIFRILAFEDSKWRKLKAAATGIVDGCVGTVSDSVARDRNTQMPNGNRK